ncbi:Bug family tripartite tricarboxylate transporter substrate binding protein [Advenella mimigardefordensis]|uniref:Putative Bug-like extracytoplasmic solute binding receptor, TTT family n=1 Tax=Advenella mimigardefordensis (strain DSM 17166 / LMG 22922 / DPN7) TaxID=1247726 RepID=W0PGT7_ADVMD|nr:tripartite tricarboxylate transporter substrate binding protein [Advenella mimigardefordensis]AHG64565.1 putative Bug-like extracytoplasmic solute binding receptor, TTT family [Advenella mimigardefordensis DPN7]
MNRRTVNKALLAALVSPGWSARALAKASLPDNKPLHILVPFNAGGTTDVLARAIAQGMSTLLKVPVVVENKPGASGTIAAGQVARARPDGTTLMLTTGSTATLIPHTISIKFDPLSTLRSVAVVGRTPLFLYAHPSIPAKTLPDLVQWIKAHPGKIAYGSYGAGTQGHFGGLILDHEAGIQMDHIPFSGGGPALQALVGGHIQLIFDAYTPGMEQVKAGHALALGASSPERSPYAPDVPTFRELGYPALEAISGFFGVFAPVNTPTEIVTLLNTTIEQVAASAEFRERLPMLGVLPPAAMTPEQMDAYVRKQNADWAQLVTKLEYKPGA